MMSGRTSGQSCTVGSDLTLTITSHAGPPEGWDDFVMQCEPSHFEQSSWWANVESVDGWGARYIVGLDRDRIVTGALVLIGRKGRLGKVGYIVRGPLISRELSDSELVQRSVVIALQELGRRKKLQLLVLVPPYGGDGLAARCQELGFLKHPWSLPPSSLPRGTTTVDLRRTTREIELGYRRTLRQEISRARKIGVMVESGTVADLELFWARHLELCQRRRVSSNVPGFEYVRRVWHEFERHGRAWLFNASLENDLLCSLICIGAGKWFYAWRIGWAPGSKKTHPTQAVYAHAIKTAKEAGYHYFDFMEIDPEVVSDLEQRKTSNSSSTGMTFYKLGFGGNVRILPPALDWFPNPALRLFMRCVGLRLLSARIFLKLVRRHGTRRN